VVFAKKLYIHKLFTYACIIRILISPTISFLETVKSANTLLLVMKGTDTRLDASLQQMLREMQALFGEEMWNHIVIGVSFWSFDQNIVEDRNK
jgi:hypothetical protein